MGRLEGKVVLITGTGGGQGRAAAIAFAREGAIVVGSDVKVGEAEETVREGSWSGGRWRHLRLEDGRLIEELQRASA